MHYFGLFSGFEPHMPNQKLMLPVFKKGFQDQVKHLAKESQRSPIEGTLAPLLPNQKARVLASPCPPLFNDWMAPGLECYQMRKIKLCKDFAVKKTKGPNTSV